MARRPIAAVFVLTLLLRLVLYFGVQAFTPFGSFYAPDTLYYHETAQQVTDLWPRDYTSIVALLYTVFGVNWQLPVALNVVASAGTVALAFATARRIGGTRGGWVAAGIVAVSPYEAFLSTQLLRDPLILFATALVLYMAVVRRSFVGTVLAVALVGWLRYRYGVALGLVLGASYVGLAALARSWATARTGAALLVGAALVFGYYYANFPGQYMMGGTAEDVAAANPAQVNEYDAFIPLISKDVYEPRAAVSQDYFAAAPVTEKARHTIAAVRDFLLYPPVWQADNAWEAAFALHMLWWYGVALLLAVGMLTLHPKAWPMVGTALVIGTAVVLFTAAPGPLIRWREPMYLILAVCAGASVGTLPPVKRMTDVTLAGVGLVVLAPVALVIAAGLSLTQRHVLYRQPRVGWHGQTFMLYKFCTMRPGSDGTPVRADHDDRVTPFGRLLRVTALDELPQLWNILRGDMSIVGPRPLATWENAMCESTIPGWQERYAIRPGLTGLGQLRARSDHARKLTGDLEYIQRGYNLWLDARIIALSAWRTVRRNWRQDC